ncbi:hypothetical protein [Sphingomonas sp.]|uniref:hypothetical protein n=1 Tax=Sphingomonas sp. TaxID=28214 RepID=UPI0025F40C71|nr:hypothetical protein [Sphingomonas sp.]
MASASYNLIEQVAAAERRRAERRTVALDTLMADRESRTFAVRILNLSEVGFMGQSDWLLCERAPVRVDIPTIGWLRADIVWVLGDRLGGSFRETVEAEAFATFVKVFGEHPRG